MRLKILCIVFSTLAIIAGGIIYVLFRPSEAVFFQWLHFAGIEDWLDSVRDNTVILNRIFPEWVVYSLPNSLWAFAYSLIITVLWIQKKSVLKYFWLASIPVLVLGFELLQYTGNIRGTFSGQDIFMGVLGMIAGFLIGRILLKLNNYEKNTN